MSKNFIFIVTIIGAVVLLGAGCAKQSSTDKKQLGNRGNNATSTERGFKIEGTKITPADLVIGKKVMVMGTTNADGTISATQILLGDFMSRAGFSSSTFSTSTARRNLNQGQPRTGGNANWQGQRGEGQGQGEGAGGTRAANRPQMQGARGAGRVVGDIIKKDSTSLVLKDQSGGSKIIFYSEKTEILIVAPPATAGAPTSPVPTEASGGVGATSTSTLEKL